MDKRCLSFSFNGGALSLHDSSAINSAAAQRGRF